MEQAEATASEATDELDSEVRLRMAVLKEKFRRDLVMEELRLPAAELDRIKFCLMWSSWPTGWDGSWIFCGLVWKRQDDIESGFIPFLFPVTDVSFSSEWPSSELAVRAETGFCFAARAVAIEVCGR